MSRAAAARRLAAAAAYGGGGLSLLGGSFYGLLRAEAKLARRNIGETHGRVPDSTGWYGRGRPAPAIKIALLGDSSAAGYGVTSIEQTPGAWLGSGLAEQADRRVHLREFAHVGAQSSDLVAQVAAALPTEPDVAVILIGANDVTHSVLPAASVRFLSEAVRPLREAGVEVVVGTCPDLGTVAPIPRPLRQVARLWSRRLAAAQTIAVVEAGGRTVSLGSILGPEFAAAPAVLFGPDRFHPSAAGYERLARTLTPSVLAALGLGEAGGRGAAHGSRRGRDADRVRRRQGQPEPRDRDRRHRGRRSQARCRRPLGDADAAAVAAHRRGRDARRGAPAERAEHDDAPAEESTGASS